MPRPVLRLGPCLLLTLAMAAVAAETASTPSDDTAPAPVFQQDVAWSPDARFSFTS